jgi:hypothetical protein
MISRRATGLALAREGAALAVVELPSAEILAKYDRVLKEKARWG